MALAHSPRIVTDGLVLCLDAGNLKSYDKYENLLQQSQALATSPWGIYSGGGFSVSNNVTSAPDGTFTASQINANPYTAGDSVYQDVSVSGTGTYTLSIFVKGGTCDSITLAAFYTGNSTQGFSFGFNPLTGTITGGSGTVVPYPNGWYRIYFTVTGTNASNNTLRFQIYTDTTGITYLWGAQLEKGSSLTDYYPTTTIAKNRGTTWTDLSGNGNNGTLKGTTTFNQNTIDLGNTQNTTNYILLPNSLISGITDFTISLWVNAVSITSGSLNCIFHATNTGGNDFSIEWYNNRIQTLITSTYSTFNYTFANNTWYNFVFYRTSGNTMGLYINGVSQGTQSCPSTTFNISGAIVMGQEQDGVEGGFQSVQSYVGKYANVLYYNKALTASEIQQNFNALRGRFGI